VQAARSFLYYVLLESILSRVSLSGQVYYQGSESEAARSLTMVIHWLLEDGLLDLAVVGEGAAFVVGLWWPVEVEVLAVREPYPAVSFATTQ